MKKKSFDLGGNRTHDLRIRSTIPLPTELRGRTEKVRDDLGGESRRRESTCKGTYECCAIPLPTELRGRTEKVRDDLGGESRRRESTCKGTYECCAM